MLDLKKNVLKKRGLLWSLSLITCMGVTGCVSATTDESDAFYRDYVVKPIEEDSPVGKAIRMSDQQEYALDATSSQYYSAASGHEKSKRHTAVSVSAPAIPLDIQSAPVPQVAAESLGGDTAPIRDIAPVAVKGSVVFKVAAPSHIHIPNHAISSDMTAASSIHVPSHLHIPNRT